MLGLLKDLCKMSTIVEDASSRSFSLISHPTMDPEFQDACLLLQSLPPVFLSVSSQHCLPSQFPPMPGFRNGWLCHSPNACHARSSHRAVAPYLDNAFTPSLSLAFSLVLLLSPGSLLQFPFDHPPKRTRSRSTHKVLALPFPPAHYTPSLPSIWYPHPISWSASPFIRPY